MKLRDHVVKGSYDFKGRCFSQNVSMLTRLVTIGIVIYNIYCFSFVLSPHLSTYLNGHATLWLAAPHHRSLRCQLWWLQALWQQRYNIFNLSSDFMLSRAQKIVRLYWKKPLTVTHHLAKWSQTFRQQRYNVFNLSCDHM